MSMQGTTQAALAVDKSYEWKVVTVLALGTALVGIDRYMVVPMFPILTRDLDFGYRAIGIVTGSLGVAYGISALLVGSLSDRVGRYTIIVVAALAFSLLAGVTGLAAGLVSLCGLRALMGVADGAYMTPAIVTTIETSRPATKGRNIGIQLMMTPLFGLALTPIIVTQLLQVMDWRWVFLLVTPIGLVVTYLIYRVLKPSGAPSPAAQAASATRQPANWTDLFQYRNVRVCMIGMLCWLSSHVALSALLPSYLVDYMHLSVVQMGLILSATGFGGALGNLVMPMISDWIGRRAVILISAAGTVAFIVAFMFAPADPVLLFALLLLKSFFTFPLIALTVGPAVVEAVSPSLRASATGLITLIGEIFGGGFAPIVGGIVAERFGIQHIFILPIAAVVIGFAAACFLVETSPRVVERQRLRNGLQARPYELPGLH